MEIKVEKKATTFDLKVGSGLPNCIMLCKNMMVAWDSFPSQPTIQMAGHIGDDENMSFGVSGGQAQSVMWDRDVAVAFMNEYLGHVEDYDLIAMAVCHPVPGQVGGACNDELLGGDSSNQLHLATRRNWVTALAYRETFGTLGDLGNIAIPEDGPMSVIWAIGKMAKPTQVSVREMGGLGLSPGIIFCRGELAIDEAVGDKISNSCHVSI